MSGKGESMPRISRQRKRRGNRERNEVVASRRFFIRGTNEETFGIRNVETSEADCQARAARASDDGATRRGYDSDRKSDDAHRESQVAPNTTWHKPDSVDENRKAAATLQGCAHRHE